MHAGGDVGAWVKSLGARLGAEVAESGWDPRVQTESLAVEIGACFSDGITMLYRQPGGKGDKGKNAGRFTKRLRMAVRCIVGRGCGVYVLCSFLKI